MRRLDKLPQNAKAVFSLISIGIALTLFEYLILGYAETRTPDNSAHIWLEAESFDGLGGDMGQSWMKEWTPANSGDFDLVSTAPNAEAWRTITIPSEGEYRVWGRVGYNYDHGWVTTHIDGQIVSRTSCDDDRVSQRTLRWADYGVVHLEEGEHTITVTAGHGEEGHPWNVLDVLLVTRDSSFEPPDRVPFLGKYGGNYSAYLGALKGLLIPGNACLILLFLFLREKGRARRLRLLLGIYLCLAILQLIVTPFNGAPDEWSHFQYVKYIAENLSLPLQPRSPASNVVGIAHNPPLYYLALVPLYTAFDFLGEESIVYLLRSISIAMGGITILFVYRIAQLIFPQSDFIVLGSTAFVALLPQFVFHHSTITNDTLVTLLSTGTLYLALRYRGGPSRPYRRDMFLGVLIGLALLAKYFSFFLIPLVLLAVWIEERSLIARAKRWLFILLGIALTSGWWFVRNYLIYGDVLANNRWREYYATPSDIAKIVWDHYGGLVGFSNRTFATFWADFGWYKIHVAESIYLALWAVTLLSFLGVVSFVVKNRRNETLLSKRQKLQLWYLWLAFLSLLCLLWLVFMHEGGLPGRRFFPAISAIALFFTLGIQETVGRLRPALVLNCMVSGLTLLNIICIVFYILPYWIIHS